MPVPGRAPAGTKSQPLGLPTTRDRYRTAFSVARSRSGAPVSFSARMSCPELTSTHIAPTPLFGSLSEAARIGGLIGDGLVATSCAPRGWDYSFTRSTAGNYPRGALSTFFHREQTVANVRKLAGPSAHVLLLSMLASHVL